MPLFLRPTGLSSPAFADWADYCVIEDGQVVGRIYEDRHIPPEYRWFWSITEHVDPALGITTNGPASRRPRASSSRVGTQRVGRVGKKSDSKAIQVQEWRVVLIRNRGHLLGWVKAANLEAAEIAAAKTFNLNDWKRKRLLLRPNA